MTAWTWIYNVICSDHFWVQWIKVRSECLSWGYWWNCWWSTVTARIWIYNVIWSFFVFSEWNWEVIVCFVDIGGMVGKCGLFDKLTCASTFMVWCLQTLTFKMVIKSTSLLLNCGQKWTAYFVTYTSNTGQKSTAKKSLKIPKE